MGTSVEAEFIPPSQLFRVLLIRMLETQETLTSLVCSTTNLQLKLCHQQNAYMLSEIESWLADQLEDTDLTPTFSAAQLADLQRGVASCILTAQASSSTDHLTPTARPARTVPRLGSRRAPSSQRFDTIRQGLERDSTGRIIFRSK